MGTNYYLHRDVCGCCNRGRDVLHVGKSSAGWCFALNTHPHEGIASLDDWQHAWTQPTAKVFDEYGREKTAAEMLAEITKREHPRGLRRHTLDGRHCLSHGDGTYDIMAGEFS